MLNSVIENASNKLKFRNYDKNGRIIIIKIYIALTLKLLNHRMRKQ